MSFTSIQEIGEFGLIDRLQAILGPPEADDILAGIRDDAAVYRTAPGRVHVVTTDALIENVHFDRSFTPLEYLGFKAVSVNVSDVVAMNATPRFATIALGLPGHLSVEMVEAFYRGVKRACATYDLTIIGGDTTAAHRLTLSITVIGEGDEDQIAYRNGARPGDLLVVTGDLGAGYAGLKLLIEERRALQEDPDDVPNLEGFPYVLQRQLVPTARLDVVRDWATQGVRPSAAIDISDGLASEVHHLCRQSGCGALVYGAALPIDLQTRQVADLFGEDVDTYALFGGEDYELLFALPPDQRDRLEAEGYAVIGTFTDAADGIRIKAPEGDVLPLEAAGFQHFGNDLAAT